MDWISRIPCVLEMISKHAPNFPISAALELAERIERTERAEHNMAVVIGTLSESRLGLSSNGELPNLDGACPAVRWAMREVQRIHAGWACGPGPGIAGLMNHKPKAQKGE
jgi:hypothetical protein